MTLHIGDTAPDFVQDSTQGEIRFHDWLGNSWGVLFSHPKGFTEIKPDLRTTPQPNL